MPGRRRSRGALSRPNLRPDSQCGVSQDRPAGTGLAGDRELCLGSLIGDLQYQLTTGAHQAGGEAVNTDALKQRITDLGLNFALVTPWTAFVAVSEKIYNPNPAKTPTLPVLVAQVKGTTELAYGEPAAPITSASAFTGGGAPEPATLFGLAVVGLLLAGFLIQERSRQAGR